MSERVNEQANERVTGFAASGDRTATINKDLKQMVEAADCSATVDDGGQTQTAAAATAAHSVHSVCGALLHLPAPTQHNRPKQQAANICNQSIDITHDRCRHGTLMAVMTCIESVTRAETVDTETVDAETVDAKTVDAKTAEMSRILRVITLLKARCSMFSK